MTKWCSGHSRSKLSASSERGYQPFVNGEKKYSFSIRSQNLPQRNASRQVQSEKNYFASSVNCGVCLFINTVGTLLSAPLPSDTQNWIKYSLCPSCCQISDTEISMLPFVLQLSCFVMSDSRIMLPLTGSFWRERKWSAIYADSSDTAVGGQQVIESLQGIILSCQHSSRFA